ncbi:MAG: alcohol dehydrogenase catalytic domain-containing protein [Candidatus Margulisbacteria bacterium]|nr:alcohol dehydrogenase catalytic domain-containing protein [Candidatus Margulisiibacteriota bacterium]
MPTPKIGPGEILVKVNASGICGSDVMEWYRIKKAPLVLGHEIAGEIVEVGEGVSKYKIGARVFVSHHIPCNTCKYCLAGQHTACHTLQTTNYDPGGFAEYIRIPALNVDRGVFLLPDEVTDEEGVFIEPLACVIRGQRMANLKIGQSVIILGSGISGLLHLLLAKACGAGKIIMTDISESRLEAAKKLGADEVYHAKDKIPHKADLVIICAGALSVAEQALKLVEKAGTILFFAPTDPGVNLSVPVNDFWRNGITLLPSYGNSPQDAVEAIELIRSKRIDVKPMVTHRLPLEEAQKGFQLVAEGKDSIKVIVKM